MTTDTEMEVPGGPLGTRPLHFIWIADCSGSMKKDGKIQALNLAIRESIPHMRKVADENPNAELLVRALKFSSGAQWHIAQPTPIASFMEKWTDLAAEGATDMGRALSEMADKLRIPPMEERALPPVLVMLSDGQPTDDFMGGLKALEAQPWGKKSVRVAIAIGGDADNEVLSRFMGHAEFKPLQANSPEQLVEYIKWVSTVVVQSVSAPPSQKTSTQGVVVPVPHPPGADVKAEDVW